MKEQPPLCVLLAAGIAIALGGALFAEMLVKWFYGEFSFSISAVFAVILGFGLLRGFEIARAWLMVLSGIAGLAGILTFLAGPVLLMVSAPDGPPSLAEIFSWLPLLVLGVGAFWGSRHPATRSWCKAGISLNTMSALKMAIVFLLLGAVVAVPKIVGDKQADAVFPVFCTVKFQTESKESAAGLIVEYKTKYSEEIKPPKLAVEFRQDDELHPSYYLVGLAYEPFQLEFSVPGFKKCEYTISNGSPREVTLVLVPDKPVLRADR